MNIEQVPIGTTAASIRDDTPATTQFHGRWLLAARVVWVVIALLSVGLFAAGVPITLQRSHIVCPLTACDDGRLTPNQIAQLAAQGFSPGFVATYRVTLRSVAALVWVIVGLVIFWRKSTDRMAWFVGLMLVTNGAAFNASAVDVLASAYPIWSLPVGVVKDLGFICMSLFFCLFPNGQFVPRWTRWAVPVYPLLSFVGDVFPGSLFDVRSWPPLLDWLVLAPHFSLLVFAQIYRYRRVADLRQRQQIKWVVFGASAALVGLVSLILLSEVLVPSIAEGESPFSLVVESAFSLFMSFIPLSIGIAIVRHRLHDIDVIIRRTLVYGALTGALGLAYFGSVVLFQALFSTLNGQVSILAVATSILVAVAMFQPLRRHLQDGVNRFVPIAPDPTDEVQAASSPAQPLASELPAPLAPAQVAQALIVDVPQRDTRLRGWWLRAAWVVCVVLALLSMGLFAAGLPLYYDVLRTPCRTVPCQDDQVTIEQLQRLPDNGVSLDVHIAERMVTTVILAVVSFVVGSLLLWRRPNDRMALFVAMMVILAGGSFASPMQLAINAHPELLWLWDFLGISLAFCIYLFFYLFPDGRFVPRWTRWLTPGLIVFVIRPLLPNEVGDWLFLVFLSAWVPIGVYAQVYRYRQVSTTTQRQQSKWAMFGFSAGMIGLLVIVCILAFFPARYVPGTRSFFVLDIMLYSVVMLIPLSIGVAVLRYRLYDIDIIIRSTLIYGALTGALALAYFGIVALLQAFFGTLDDQPAILASGAALLLCAAIFQPLRRRLHAVADRRFPQPPPILSETIVSSVSSSAMDTQLRGRWLLIARAGWVVLALLIVGVFIAGLPDTFVLLRTGCALGSNVCAFEQLHLELVPRLAAAGVSLHMYAVGYLVFAVATTLVWWTTAGVIFWRKSDQWMGLLVALTLMLQGANSVTEVLLQSHGLYHVLNSLGWIALAWVFYLFPDGRFVPRWTGWLALGFSVFIVQADFFPEWLPAPSNVSPGGLLWFGYLGSILVAQVYRYRRLSGPVQRQQTKWVVFGVTTWGLLAIVLALPSIIVPAMNGPDSLYNVVIALAVPLLHFLIPLSIGIAILRRRLYDIDIIIRRTLVYGGLIGGLALVYLGSVALLQLASRTLTGPQSNLVIVATTLAIAALFQPVRRRVQDFIDRRFYREKVDFRQAFTDFSREVRTIIELPELLRVLVNRTTDLLHIAHGAVFLRDADGTFQLAEARTLAEGQSMSLVLEQALLEQLAHGASIARPEHPTFPLLVPLLVAHPGGNDLVGVLALGPRRSEQRYSRDDQTLLLGLADQAGTAINVAQLIAGKHAEAERREETEHRLETHRNSPIGRAEATAQTIIARPETALTELHRLAQLAGKDPDIATLLDHLPKALDNLGAHRLVGFADGYHYLFFSQQSPEFLSVGLRGLIAHLEQLAITDDRRPTTDDPAGDEAGSPGGRLELYDPHPIDHQLAAVDSRWSVVEGAAEALALYQLCQRSLDATSLGQIAELLRMEDQGVWPGNGRRGADDKPLDHQLASASTYPPFIADLARALAELWPVAEAVHAYERVDSAQDQLAYLASAVERLSRVDRLARAALGSADRPIIDRIVVSWLAIVTGGMSELQTRAQLVCRLLTRHTWQSDLIALVLDIRNDGRGAALNLNVSLAPAAEYTLLNEVGQIERLAAGEEAQVTLHIRPRLAAGADQLRARFLVRYVDPRGPDQVESFADVVQLRAAESPFQFIPNPYVVGTPLQSGSPLFFGRTDLLAFIEENLAAAHRNNLVLVGQRRTGKTSLLKQLPARLGDNYLPIYLDGQGLGLDPGLPNFYLALATEIAFALDDRGFSIAPPEPGDFARSPAATFERAFLGRVRELIGGRHLLLLLDEFEELEGAVRRGNLDASIFGFLRHLIQHSGNLSVIFCGTHRLEELAADYWSVLFNISLYRHVGFLERSEAERLIQEPVAPFGMRYDDLALEKIWRVTAGHPYFLQLLCHSLVNRHNRSERSYVTIADVNTALGEILAAGEAHFLYVWTESTRDERIVLTALSRMLPLAGHTTLMHVLDYLSDRGVTNGRRAIGQALHHLALRDILAPVDEADGVPGETYCWKLGLLGLWAEKYRSLSRVVDEVQS